MIIKQGVLARLYFIPLLCLVVLNGCDSPSAKLTGYVEADWVYVAAPSAGWITELKTNEGDTVSEGDELFILDQEQQTLALQQAQAQLLQAESHLNDLREGARADELAVLEAQLSESQTAAELATKELKRYSQLTKQGLASKEQLDLADTEARRSEARVKALEAQIRVAKLGARDNAINESIAARDAAQAAMAEAKWRLQERKVVARRAGRVEEIFLRTGEYAQAGAKVLALLPEASLTVRFFLPQAQLHRVKIGQTVDVYQDGLDDPVTATIRTIAREAEFTPPVIYSADSREKLVFKVEATLPTDIRLHPGQPVDVQL